MKLLRWMCFFLAITLPVSALAEAQTIANAARQERERRKAIENQTSEVPVVTSIAPAASAGSTAPVTKIPANEQLKYTGPTDLQGHGENYWRPKFDQARLAIQRAEENLKVADQKVANSSSIWGPYIVGRNTIALQQATHEREVARKALANEQQKLADLEDQLRRAGGLPGWSRPR
jgi:hypothetical protein